MEPEMLLDLKDIIEVPGAVKPFETVLDTERLRTGGIVSFSAPPSAKGRLRLEGELTAGMVCVCDRCGVSFERTKILPLSLDLTASEEDDGEAYPLAGDAVDLEDVLGAAFLLDAESKCLCRPRCKGLCPDCGKNLNDGPCGCKKHSVDPRFAVLEQLLDNETDS